MGNSRELMSDSTSSEDQEKSKQRASRKLSQLDEYIEILRFTAEQLLECMTFGHYDPRNRKVDHYEEVLERAVEIHFRGFSTLLGNDPTSTDLEQLRANLEIAKDCLHTEWRGQNMIGT